jgi:nucleoside-diphosphate-sugar epimerase
LSLEEAETLYEKSKIKAEEEVRNFVNDQGLDAVIVNPTRLYGPGPLRKSNAVTKMIRDYLRGKWRIIPGNGKGVGNYAFTEDVVEGFLLAMEHGRSGECYILGGSNIDFDGFFDTLGKVSGVRRWMFHLPIPVMIAISKIMKLWSSITKSVPLITPNWVRKYMNEQWAVEINKAQEEWRYSPHSMEEGFRLTLEWLVEEGEIEVEAEKRWEEGWPL